MVEANFATIANQSSFFFQRLRSKSNLSQAFFRRNARTNATFGIVKQDLGQGLAHFGAHIRRCPGRHIDIAARDAS
jgi:hypothetical protein